MSGNKGYVYILSNPAMEGLLKIGRSKSGAQVRMRQLESTGVPLPFELVFEVYCHDCVMAERDAHDSLSEFRENYRREFFRVDEYEAVLAVAKAALEQQSLAATEVETIQMSDALGRIAHRFNEHPIVFASHINDRGYHVG